LAVIKLVCEVELSSPFTINLGHILLDSHTFCIRRELSKLFRKAFDQIFIFFNFRLWKFFTLASKSFSEDNYCHSLVGLMRSYSDSNLGEVGAEDTLAISSSLNSIVNDPLEHKVKPTFRLYTYDFSDLTSPFSLFGDTVSHSCLPFPFMANLAALSQKVGQFLSCEIKTLATLKYWLWLSYLESSNSLFRCIFTLKTLVELVVDFKVLTLVVVQTHLYFQSKVLWA